MPGEAVLALPEKQADARGADRLRGIEIGGQIFLPALSVTPPFEPAATSANHVPDQPTATIAPRPSGASMLKNGKAFCDERPPSGAI